MLKDFIKWLENQPQSERGQIMQTLIDVFAPTPMHSDFMRLKAALARRDKRIRELEAENKKLRTPSLDNLWKAVVNMPDYREIRTRIVGAYLYRNLAEQNKLLRRRNRTLQADVEDLIYKLHYVESKKG